MLKYQKKQNSLYKVLQIYDAIISKSSNEIVQTDHIKMHIATGLDAAPVAAQPYPFALKHHDFLNQEIKNLLDGGIIYKSMCPWASSIVVVENIHLKVFHSSFTCVLIIKSWTPYYWQ